MARFIGTMRRTLCLTFAALLMTACAPGEAPTEAPGAVNRALGDASYQERFGHAAPPGEDDTRRVTTHLSHVESLLRARDVSSWPDELRLTRARNLDRLNEYWSAGRFPRNHAGEARHPRFVDEDDVEAGLDDSPRICAVGHLFALDRGVDAARAVAARYQDDHVPDIRDEALLGWAATSGLTLDELAMIQPSYGWIDRPRPIVRPPPRPVASPEAVQRALATLEPRINGCILQKLAPSDPHPHEIKAAVVAHQTTVQSVKFDTGLKARNIDLERCLAGVVSSARFALDFRAGPVSVTQRWATFGPTDRAGQFRPSYAPVLFQRAHPAALRCAAGHLPAPRAALQVLVEASLSPDGKLVTSRVIALPEIQINEAFLACIKTSVEGIAGPRFKGSEARVSHVFSIPEAAE